MKFIVLGSGGCVSLPKPLCQCAVCKEARQKGKPYSRFGCSLFLSELNVLVDTPEDISHALNAANISEINGVLYSHMDPDHTLGMRIFEHLRLDWLKLSEGIHCDDPIPVYALPEVLKDLNSIQTKLGSFMAYYEAVRNLIIQVPVVETLKLQDINIHFIPVGQATVFVFEQKGKKLIYAPCDVKPFPDHEVFNHADYLLIGNTIPCEKLKNDYVLKPGNFLSDELFSMNEILALKEKYHIQKVIMTHLEEDWGKSYDDYLEMEKQYENITFAYDGMIIEL